ncbi:MAG: 30S ribosomal protein S4 [Planctomycetaceae bacterium]|nr:30S ribosomal protein S4 [Planctomycetaceae bacterium]
MARNTESVCRKCRREGMKLFLKGSRCEGADGKGKSKCAFDRRSSAPGMHGARRGKLTDYGIHLREKQKVKNYYGVLEKQFRKYFAMASRMKGNTGDALMGLLERRLDNIVYRLGFGASRPQSRQWVSHGHILVNGKRVDVPSYLVRSGDRISVRSRPKSTKAVKEVIDIGLRDVPEFLFRDNAEQPKGIVMRLPSAEDVSLKVDASLIVELCSK